MYNTKDTNKEEEMLINEDGFTYKAMMEKLTTDEVKLMLKLFEYMTDDNLLYLYQKVSKRINIPIIEKIAKDLGITKKTVQNMISSITAKQEDVRYFITKTASSIRGEYFISPELAVKQKQFYETIWRNIVRKLEKEAVEKVKD